MGMCDAGQAGRQQNDNPLDVYYIIGLCQVEYTNTQVQTSKPFHIHLRQTECYSRLRTWRAAIIPIPLTFVG